MDSPTDEQTPKRARFCVQCGQPAGDGRFCGHCGHALPGTDDPAATRDLGGGAPPGPPGEHDTVVLPAAPEPATVGEPVHPGGPETSDAGEEELDLAWVEERDDAQDVVVQDAPPADPRRRALTVAAAALAAVAVAGAGVLVAGYVGDSGMRNALASSTRDYNAVLDALGAAPDDQAVAEAAEAAEPAVDRIDGALRRLGADRDPAHQAVVEQLEAEQAVLEAVDRLTDVGSDPLATWGDAHDDLTGAVDAEQASRRALAKHHEGAADEITDAGDVLDEVTGAVGPALVADATDESVRLLKTLQGAKTTADLRTLGDAAAPERAAVSAAAQALPDGEGKQVLTGYASALGALGKLSRLDAESTSAWTGTRAELAETFGSVAGAAAEGGTGVRAVLDSALGSADKVVAAARAAIADWKAKTDEAVKARQADTEGLQSYASFFRSQTKTYEQLRQDLSTFVARVEDPSAEVSYAEAYAFLSEAAQDRRDVRDLMVGMDVPAGVRAAHQDVVAAIDRAISAVQSAYDGLEQSQDCYFDDCPYYRDTPGWQRFQAESDAIGKQYTGASSRWEAAAAAEKATIANRPLPEKPQV